MAAMRATEEAGGTDVDRKDRLMPLRVKGFSAFMASERIGHDEPCRNVEKDHGKDDQDRNENISRDLILLSPPIDSA